MSRFLGYIVSKVVPIRHGISPLSTVTPPPCRPYIVPLSHVWLLLSYDI